MSENRLRSDWLELRSEIIHREYSGQIPDGLSVGKPFRTMAAGPCVSPHTGRSVDVVEPITEATLVEFARMFEAEKASTPVIIDWNHGSARDATSPTGGKSLGRVLQAWVEDVNDGRGPGLYVLPGYTAEGAALVAAQKGALWSSPEFYVGPVFDRKEEDKQLGSAQLFAVALTGRPAQATDTIDPVLLSQQAQGAPRMAENTPIEPTVADPTRVEEMPSIEELALQLEAKTAEIQELTDKNVALEAKVAEMEGSAGAAEEGLRTLTSTHGTELTSLRTLNTELTGKVEAAELTMEIEVRCAKGFIAPHEKDKAIAAYALRTSNPIFWNEFKDRTEPVIRLTPVGHGKDGPPNAHRTTDQKVRERCERDGLSFQNDYMKALTAIEAEEAASK